MTNLFIGKIFFTQSLNQISLIANSDIVNYLALTITFAAHDFEKFN